MIPKSVRVGLKPTNKERKILGKTASVLAHSEGLQGHARAAIMRLL